MNRRQFLAAASGAISLRADASAGQPFTAGIVPVGRSSAPGEAEGFRQHCDDVAKLAFHHIEINNTRAKIAEYYSARTSEFKDKMARRGLSMAGFALFSRASSDGERAEVLTHHLLLGRFLAAVGGKYITHMLAIGDVLNEPGDVAAYRDVDLTSWVKKTQTKWAAAFSMNTASSLPIILSKVKCEPDCTSVSWNPRMSGSSIFSSILAILHLVERMQLRYVSFTVQSSLAST
jgi:hypothetical protein